MPVTDVIFLSTVIIAFVTLAVALGWANHRTG